MLATVLCNLVPWLLAIGYSLCFGTIVAKMFRIYYIFNNPHSKKRVSDWNDGMLCFYSFPKLQSITDWILALIVSVFVLIDLIILISYTLFMSFSNNDGLRAEEIINGENPEDIEGVSSSYRVGLGQSGYKLNVCL